MCDDRSNGIINTYMLCTYDTMKNETNLEPNEWYTAVSINQWQQDGLIENAQIAHVAQLGRSIFFSPNF